MGRHKYQWEDDVRNDLRKMKLIKWAEQVQDRLKWKDIVERVSRRHLQKGSVAGWSTSTGHNGEILVIPKHRLETQSGYQGKIFDL